MDQRHRSDTGQTVLLQIAPQGWRLDLFVNFATVTPAVGHEL